MVLDLDKVTARLVREDMAGQNGGMAELVDAKVCDYRENVVLSFPIWNFSNSCGFESRYHHE